MGAAMLKTLVQTHSGAEGNPAQLLERMNGGYAQVALPEDLATMLVTVWEPQKQQIAYANAGHEPAYIMRASGETVSLAATGLPLGAADASCNWEVVTLAVAPRDRLVMVTDGVVEAPSPSGELFGRERLLTIIERCRDQHVQDALQNLRAAVAGHRSAERPTDDMTLLMADF